eukprot:6279183-Amphidinium_carterae.1
MPFRLTTLFDRMSGRTPVRIFWKFMSLHVAFWGPSLNAGFWKHARADALREDHLQSRVTKRNFGAYVVSTRRKCADVPVGGLYACPCRCDDMRHPQFLLTSRVIVITAWLCKPQPWVCPA